MIGITSFSAEGYERYGKHFLKFIDNFPGKIIAYLESPIDFEHEKLEKRNFFEIEGVGPFLTNIKSVPICHGDTDQGYNYNFDLWKFCRKMFCQFDAFKEGGKVIWLDADLELSHPIPAEKFDDWFDGKHLFFLGRDGFYTETGIVGFDTEHPDFEEFKERYIDTLRKGRVFTFDYGWHDCYCFDYARKGKGNNLTSWWKKGDTLHIMPKTELSQYMVHRKGNRKDEICEHSSPEQPDKTHST